MRGGGAVLFALYALLMKKQGMRATTAILAYPIAAVLAAVLAKVSFVLIKADSQFSRFGLNAFFNVTKPNEYCFFFGCVGGLIGVALAARLTHEKPMRALDTFAPFAALLVALARFAEGQLFMVGLGPIAEAGKWPSGTVFAATYYTLDYVAVYMFEACAALIAAIGAWLYRNKGCHGMKMEWTVFFLCLPQIFFESYRSSTLRWGFLRCEQLFAMLTMLGLTAKICYQTKGNMCFMRRYLPAVLMVGIAGLLVCIELALDKWTDWSALTCYLLMGGVLVLAALCRYFAVRRMMKSKKAI